MAQMTTWMRQLVIAKREAEDESETLVLAPSESAFHVEFDCGYGQVAGGPVLAWTEDRVYFPVACDGQEWLDSAPRNPQDEVQDHVGLA